MIDLIIPHSSSLNGSILYLAAQFWRWRFVLRQRENLFSVGRPGKDLLVFSFPPPFVLPPIGGIFLSELPYGFQFLGPGSPRCGAGRMRRPGRSPALGLQASHSKTMGDRHGTYKLVNWRQQSINNSQTIFKQKGNAASVFYVLGTDEIVPKRRIIV